MGVIDTEGLINIEYIGWYFSEDSGETRKTHATNMHLVKVELVDSAMNYFCFARSPVVYSNLKTQ